jgi:hypothetical protein
MPEGAAIGGLLCGLVIGVAVGTLIGAILLRAAVALYNRMAGGASSPSRVPEPAFGKAMWMIFATSVGQLILGCLIIGLGTGDGAEAARPRGQGPDVVGQLTFFSFSLLIMVGVLSAKLPTTLGRAFFVTLCYMLVSLLVAGVLAGIAVLVAALVF